MSGKGSRRTEIFGVDSPWPMLSNDGTRAVIHFYALEGYIRLGAGNPGAVAEVLKDGEQVAWLSREALVTIRDQISSWLDAHPQQPQEKTP